MTVANQQGSLLSGWMFEAVVFGTFGLPLFFMVGAIEWGLYATGIAGAIASVWLGRASVQQGRVSVPDGIQRFGTRWLYVVGFAALSVMNSKWVPMVFAAVVGVTMTAFYALGARSVRGTRGGAA